MPHIQYSFVIPVFNEYASLEECFARLQSVMNDLDGPSEVIWVDDGSRDGSWELMRRYRKQDERFKLISLSRNFGHQVAISAGLSYAQGEAVIVLDSDMQDPPEVTPQFIEKWKAGYDVVYGVRQHRPGESRFKLLTAFLFYRILGKLVDFPLPADVGDFRLIGRPALDAFLSMPENNRFVRGMISWIGFKQTGVPYTRDERKAGETKYPLHKMVKLAWDAVVSFSSLPLRWMMRLGVSLMFCCIGYTVYAVIRHYTGQTVEGWSSLAILVVFFGGLQLFVVGVLGEYIGRIHVESKKRPLFLIQETQGIKMQASSFSSIAGGSSRNLAVGA